MTKIPFYIMEEHHEAFFIWNYAVAEGLIDKTQNTLLHVDEHSDMVFPLLNTSLKSVNHNLKQLHDLTYSELSIASFIYPAIYQGMFSGVYWLRQQHDKSSRVQKKMQIYSHQGKGKRLMLKSKADFNELFNPDYKSFTMTYMTVQDSLSSQEVQKSNKSVILDIDIDYFSCDNASGAYFEVEITQDAYDDYVNNFYNKIRLSLGGNTSVKCMDGKYYFCTIQPDELLAEKLKVSEDTIVERIDALIDFLKVNEIQPKLIDVCRSRLSGYTPNDQWEFIENTLVEKLSSIYEFEPIFVSELSKKVLVEV
ncbi:UPF0489 family protein [Kamptonema sp. UHCC 0994]|uniref:UPF0489 family protein n=1 Tax=Kamptonema sp. UHCC 0994 TaxID=3031329 RepID=UPI0023B9BA83|nr:UPF0489 family protein [Kamptonema sp. UHCC 0994]MDF0555978.1 UPF0489 family protein [Kamptonema sp. UHCC 0994]